MVKKSQALPSPICIRNYSHQDVARGIKYEPIALQEYEKFMFNRKSPVSVLKSGLVVSNGYPVLGATPDAKIVDYGCSICFGLGEVKCPHTQTFMSSHWIPIFKMKSPILCPSSRTNGCIRGQMV